MNDRRIQERRHWLAFEILAKDAEAAGQVWQELEENLQCKRAGVRCSDTGIEDKTANLCKAGLVAKQTSLKFS